MELRDPATDLKWLFFNRALVFLVTYCLVLFVVLLIGMLVVVAIRYGLTVPALSYPDPAVNPLVSWLLGAFVNFRAGQWIAQRAPGREVAASVALWLLRQAVAILLTIGVIIVFHFDLPAFTPADLLFESPMGLVSDVALFAGALQVRRRALRD
jgi:hypothetical protein